MSHEWHKGTLNASSWHGLEEVGAMVDADAMIGAGERTGAWPTQVDLRDIFTGTDQSGNILSVPGRAVVATYADGYRNALGAVGDRYTATTPAQWRDLVRAAVKAGGKPTGAFSLRGGTRMLATFEVGQGNGIRTHLVLADAFDGSLKLHGGVTSIRVVCANTLSAAMRSDGKAWAALRHTSGITERIPVLREAIGEAVAIGAKVKEAYQTAEQIRLVQPDAEALLNKLFPIPDEPGRERTRAENRQREALQAMSRPENNAGPTLATLWNAATWLVDREVSGMPRAARGGADRLDSLLFGARGERLREIQDIVEVVMRDGTIAQVPMAQYADRKAVEGDATGSPFASLLAGPARLSDPVDLQ